MTSLVSASQVVTGQVQSLDSVRAHALPSDAMIFASATKVQPVNQNPGSYVINDQVSGSTPTINGSVPAVTLSPFADLYKEGSVYIDGVAADYISTALTGYTMSQGISMEMFVNYQNFTNSTYTIGFMAPSAATYNFTLGVNGSGVPIVTWTGGTLTASSGISSNTWNHLACAWNGSVLQLFVNGVYNNGTASFTPPTLAQNFLIGRANSLTCTAYVTDVRIVTNPAVYYSSGSFGSTAFTVPSAPLSPAATGTTNFMMRVGQNAPTIQSGALTFDRGLKQFMNFGAQNFNIATRGFTAVFKYTWNGAVGNYERIFDIGVAGASPSYAYAVGFARAGTGNQYYFYVNAPPPASTNPQATTAAGVMNQGTSYVVACRWSSTTGLADIWINGAFNCQSSQTPSPAIADFTSSWTALGTEISKTYWASDSLSSFAIYNRALSNVEILNAYSALTAATTNAPIEIGDVNGVTAFAVTSDGRVNVTKLGQTSNVVQWPPAAMTGYVTSINGGTYVASASSEYSVVPSYAWYAFDSSTTTWTSQVAPYQPQGYVGSVTTTDTNGSVWPGEWLQIQLPLSTILSSYAIQVRSDGFFQTEPARWAVLGSRDGINWTLVNTQTGVTWASVGQTRTFTASAIQAFSFYRCVFQATTITSGASAVVVQAWTLYGTADTAQTLTVSQPVTLSYGAQTASLTGISGDKYVPQDFSSSGLNIPAYITTSNAISASNVIVPSSFGPFTGQGSLYYPGGSAPPTLKMPYTTAPSLNFNPFTGDFTAEAWVYNTVATTYNTIVGNYPEDWAFKIVSDRTVQFYDYNTGAALGFNLTGGTVPLNTWTHVAVTYSSSSTTARIFVNGTLATSTGTYTGTPRFTSTQLEVGSFNNGSHLFNGYIGEVRIVRGAALYTSAFTPPTGPLQPIQGVTQAGLPYGTVLLLRNAPAPGRVLTSKFGGANSGGVNGAPLTLAFPPAAMTTYATTLNSGYGQGTYVASASSDSSGFSASRAFDYIASTIWSSNQADYTTYSAATSSNTYSGSVTTVDVNGTSYAGQWLQIQQPSAIALTGYTLQNRNDTAVGGGDPKTWWVLGSRDGTSWNLVDQRSGITWSSAGSNNSITVTSSQAFTYFRLVVNVIGVGVGVAVNAVLAQWTLNGTIEGPNVTADGRLGVGVSNPVQALEVAGSAVVTGTLSAGNPLMFRNRVINGDFRIDQRSGGASFTQTASGPNYGSADRWSVYGRLASKFSVQQSSVVPQGAGLSNSWLITSLSAYTTVTSDYYGIAQLIEGYNIADLMWGTSYGVPATVSFWIRSSVAGNYTFNVQGPSLTPSYSVQYAIGGTNSWQYVTITIPPPPSGTTFGALNTLGCRLWWDLGSSDTSYAVTTPGVWQSGDKVRVSGSVNFVATNGATMYITGVQLEKGTLATPFEVRPYAVELQLCQRYFHRNTGFISPMTIISTTNTNQGQAAYKLPVTMRISPAVSFTGTPTLDWTSVSYNTVGGLTTGGGTDVVGLFAQTIGNGNAGSVTIGQVRYLYANGGNIDFNSEL